MSESPFRTIRHQVDVCVVGGGMAGFCAALSARRMGARVAIMQDRPMLGGNSSSEIRMHICGADRHNRIPYLRETGILEELRLESLRRNSQRSYSLWDLLLHERLAFDEGVDLLLNCSCLDAEMGGDDQIASITGWQTTTQQYHEVEADVFIDCSGDGILAPLTGAEYRVGREARDEFGESIAPEIADRKTMGMTCLFQAKRCDTPQPFEPYPWANVYETDDDLPYGAPGHKWVEFGYWWLELGGDDDSIADTEVLRDRLLKVVFGIWDHIKNKGDHGAENWALDWVGFLPGKRESRRYVGDYVVTQRDVEAEGRFSDIVAYAGWTMDDHHPAGFGAHKLGQPATIFHPAPSPWGIPYRALYSRNVKNLMFAGRCASFSHAALSSARVAGTACVMGQAAGTAAALAAEKRLTPREFGMARVHLEELQRNLQRQDCYLPFTPEWYPELTRSATLTASNDSDPEAVRDGWHRQIGDDPHAWIGRPGDSITFAWDEPQEISELTLILDSALEKDLQMSYHREFDCLRSVPDVMVRKVDVEALVDGEWQLVAQEEGNHQRLCRMGMGRSRAQYPFDLLPIRASALRVTFGKTWGAGAFRVYGAHVGNARGWRYVPDEVGDASVDARVLRDE